MGEGRAACTHTVRSSTAVPAPGPPTAPTEVKQLVASLWVMADGSWRVSSFTLRRKQAPRIRHGKSSHGNVSLLSLSLSRSLSPSLFLSLSLAFSDPRQITRGPSRSQSNLRVCRAAASASASGTTPANPDSGGEPPEGGRCRSHGNPGQAAEGVEARTRLSLAIAIAIDIDIAVPGGMLYRWHRGRRRARPLRSQPMVSVSDGVGVRWWQCAGVGVPVPVRRCRCEVFPASGWGRGGR